MRSETVSLETGVALHYREDGEGDTVVLLHGFPETSWQWHRAMPLLAAAGYRAIAPDLRGAGHSSRPSDGYDKASLAADVHALVHAHLGLTRPALVVGHDIGAMVAVAYALRYRGDVRSLCFGECPLPGTASFAESAGDPDMFHFAFQAQRDLPEALVSGREEVYLQHFYDREAVHPEAIDTAHYARAFRGAGALRAGFELYRTFEQDAIETRAALERGGRLRIPVLVVHGEVSSFAELSAGMGREVAEDSRVAVVPDSGHYLAEENPDALVDLLVGFDAPFRSEREKPDRD